ncbi:MAG: electron transport complex subunit E [Eubacteriales bacterium]|nr:electron transport complex subunit E [Eubacteriales bacterium]MDY4898761.1 electron transport complex subunit E [Eubacteriales bacterium]
MSFKSFAKQLRSGIIDNNPVFIQLLGMCPTLATTTSVKNAVGMGLAATAVLICSNILISLLRKFIPKQVRIAAYIVIISGFVTAVELLIKAYFYDLYGSLGLFIPLIVVNCIILARAEAFASKNPVLPSAVDGLSMGLGFTFALIIIATVREILGNGTFLGISLFGDAFSPAIIFILPSGAFLTLGFIVAVVQKLNNNAKDKQNARAAAAEAEARAAARAQLEAAAQNGIQADSDIIPGDSVAESPAATDNKEDNK